MKRGLVPTGGGALKLAHQLHYHVALELLLTGDPISAERAHHCGFVNRVTPDGTALDEALEVAQALAGNGPLALEAIKRIVRESPDWTVEEAPSKQRAIAAPVFESNDAKEASTPDRSAARRCSSVWPDADSEAGPRAAPDAAAHIGDARRAPYSFDLHIYVKV